MNEESIPARRAFLKHSACLFGALTLPGVLRARAQASPADDTAVIFITLGGGPSQHETYDPKPGAPLEIRGQFKPIGTNVAGVQFSELLPRQAKLMDKMAIIRSVHHEQASHIAEHIVETGYDLRSSINSPVGEMPSIGSIVSKLRGPSPMGLPAYVSLPKHHGYTGPHWLGGQHAAFTVNEDPNLPAFTVKNLTLAGNLNVDRLNDRRTLLADLETARREFDAQEAAGSIDAFTRQAFNLVTGEEARQAFDLTREPAARRDAYGRTMFGQRVLLARRLVEAGVPFVTVRMGDWDDHTDLAKKIVPRAALYDAGLSALITDLHERGLNRKVLVIAMGEFGRTPRVNPQGGRDHWPAVNNVVLSGGAYRMGQVIGSTDRIGGTVTSAPYRPQNVLGMVYRHLGIDPAITFNDFSGRPRYALEERAPVTELL